MLLSFLLKQNFLNNIVLFFLLLFIPSCGLRNGKNNLKKNNLLIEKEARLYDIPLMLEATGINFDEKRNQELYKDQTVTYLVSEKCLDDIAAFYCHEMERLGWNFVTKFIGRQEIALYFQKPSSISLISVRTIKKSSVVTIFLQRRTDIMATVMAQ